MEPVMNAMNSMNALATDANALNDIKKLASDEFEGRAPGSKGEALTVQYLTEQFKAIGLQPGNPNGTYTQAVPLVGLQPDKITPLKISGKGTVFTFIVDHRNEVPGFDGHYVFAFINPVEAPRTSVRLTGNILDCDPDDVYIGMPVEVFYKELKPGVTLPQFRPAPEAKLRSKGQTP